MSLIDHNCDLIDLNDLEKIRFPEFEININKKCEDLKILQLLDKDFEIQNYNFSGNRIQSHDDHLKELIETNIQQRSVIDKKLELLTQGQAKYQQFKQDQKILFQEIKETHEAFLMTKKYYKKFLNIYFSSESKDDKDIIFVQFFTETKRDSENYSVKLLKNTKSREYQLLSTSPKLTLQKELQARLRETNDLPGALSYIRQAFLHIKNKK